jgi:hypothetical protein
VYVILILATLAYGGEKQARNAYWWSASSPSFKLGYVYGYASAMDQAAIIEMGRCAGFVDMVKDKYPGQNVFQKLCTTDAFDFDGIAMGQFVDGVDVFYKDFRNKQLEVDFALQYVRDEIKGKSAKDLDAELTAWRACSAAVAIGDGKKINDSCK